MPLTVEICVEGLEGALAAERGGADRVELCSHLAVGGVTPGPGALAVACRSLKIPVHVLIRPRGGDFVYSAAEYAEMLEDVAHARRAGAAGVVIGCLKVDASIERSQVAELIAAARPVSVTFHKAFDIVPEPFEALETLIALGVNRVLTSGCGRAAREDVPLLAELVQCAAGRLEILVGGSLCLEDFQALAAVGVREVHLGSAASTAGQTSVEKVREIMQEARRWG